MSQSVDLPGDPSLELWLVSSHPVMGGKVYWRGTLSLGSDSTSGGGGVAGWGGGGVGGVILGGGGGCVVVGLEWILE